VIDNEANIYIQPIKYRVSFNVQSRMHLHRQKQYGRLLAKIILHMSEENENTR